MATLYLFLSGCDLPGDIIMDIVSRLSIEDVTKARLVSKNWNGSISDATFLKWHYEVHKKDETTIILQRTVNVLAYCSSTFHVVPLNERRLVELKQPTEVDFFFPIRVASVCNGVVCYRYRVISKGMAMCLWNPTTNKHRRLLSIESHDHLMDSNISFGYDNLSSGYDNLSSSFIVVLVYQKWTQHGAEQWLTEQWMSRFHVKSGLMASRKLEGFMSQKFSIYSVYMNCCINWLGLKFDGSKNLGYSNWIVSYDVSSGSLVECVLPSPAMKIGATHMMTYGEKVALVHYDKAGCNRCLIQVWCLNDCGGPKSSWEKVITVGPISPVYNFRLIINNQMLVVREPRVNPHIFQLINSAEGRVWTFEDNRNARIFLHVLGRNFRFPFYGNYCRSLFSVF